VEYNLKIAQHQFHTHVEIHEDRQLTISVDENIFNVSYHLISAHQIHMMIHKDGRSQRVSAFVAHTPEGKIVCINGRQYLACDQEKEGQKFNKGTSPNLPDQITPPMPAVVVRIVVQEGDFVRKGQGIIVVSAMKMETTLCAPFDGSVAKINCAVNDKVMPGQILAEIEKTED
jgi:biotin carboxyl carrier protein